MDPKTIRTRLQELAFLNSSATIWFRAVPASPSSPSSSSNGASAPESSGSNGAEPHAAAAAAGPPGREEQDGWERLHFSGGLREYVAFLNKDMQPMHEPLFITDKVGRCTCAWCAILLLRFRDAASEKQCGILHVCMAMRRRRGW